MISGSIMLLMKTLNNFFVIHKFFFLSLVLVVILDLFRFKSGIVQQDNYVGYAMVLPSPTSQLSFYDSRLFPGLPIVISLFSRAFINPFLIGYIVAAASFAGSYFLVYKMTDSKLSVLPLIFPPILLNLATIISSEMPFIFLTLLALLFAKKRSFSLAFLAIGISVWFRLAGVGVFFGVFVYLFLTKKFRELSLALPYFLLPVSGLLIYNFLMFGSKGIFYQLATYRELVVGRSNVVIIQLALDVLRALRWHWFRILISGLFYIIFLSYVLIKSIKLGRLEFWLIAGLYLFTLSFGAVPFLENLGRYLAPAVPIFWVRFYREFSKEWLFYILLPLSVVLVAI